MNDLYRVCIIVPRGYTHAQCFTETAFLLKHSLHSLGVPCDISVNDPARDRINVLLGWHLVPGIDMLPSCTFIPYQLEQLSDAAWDGLSPASKAILQRAFDVWDYSEENVAFLARQGIRARHVPIGYHGALERIPRDRDKDIDVLFFGSAGPRRQYVLDALARDPRIRVRALFGVYGQQRDEFISRSKIILNVHFYQTKIFEAVRVSYLLNNRCCVVSETSEPYPYQGVAVPMFPYETVSQGCRSLLDKEDDIERVREETYGEFKRRYPMTRFLAGALSGFA